ncbi:hypothetical protein [Paracoccus sp. TRP]|uniref:hypothetical protein n=1 Tax=Paracoccus sp. TRP TaxID=412597 RepID=UPI000225F6B6|nr:hypothetical protein [Paracoccus sp. TRP]
MDRSIPMLLIGLIFGGGMGFVIAAANGVTLDGHDHGANGHGAQTGTHHHGTAIDLPAGSATASARLEPDSVNGWNLFVQAQGFCFAPEHAGLAHRAGEGHAHLYLNGTKIARLYGPAHHLGSLAPGDQLRVELNANDHSPLTVGGQPLAIELTVPERPVAIRAGAEGLPDNAICATP